MKLDTKNVRESEIAVLIMVIGVTESLLSMTINIDQGEQLIFLPYHYKHLKKEGVSKEILDLIEDGFYIENYLSLLPNELVEYINCIKQRAKNLLKERFQKEPLFDGFWFIEE